MNFLNKLLNKKRKDEEKRKLKGSHLDDPFLSNLRGYKLRNRAVIDALDLHNEVEAIKGNTFPILTKKATKQGYVTYESDYFEITNSSEKEVLENYFLDKFSRYNDKLYGQAIDLANLFEFIAYQLLVDGKVFYAIDWDTHKIDNKSYILPTRFRYLRTSTLKPRRLFNRIIGFRQKYCLFTRLTEHYYKLVNVNFEKDEVLFLKYPFFKKSPVQSTMKFLKITRKFHFFGVNQSAAMAMPENHSLEIEKARYGSWKLEKRKYDIARSKIRSFFSLPVETKVTDFYYIYQVVKYKKFLNNFRDFLIFEFNNQVLKPLAIRNNLDSIPELKIQRDRFLSNQFIDKYFEKFKKRQIGTDEFIKEIIEADRSLKNIE